MSGLPMSPAQRLERVHWRRVDLGDHDLQHLRGDRRRRSAVLDGGCVAVSDTSVVGCLDGVIGRQLVDS